MPARKTIDYKLLFDDLPERFLLIGVDDPTFTILDAAIAHNSISMRNRDDIIGLPFFDVFPDVSEAFIQTGHSELAESFRSVIKTGKAHTMDTFRYDIPDQNGVLAERYWRPVHYPHFENGKLAYIIQVSQNVTDEVVSDKQLDRTQRQLEQALSIGLVGTWLWDIPNNQLFADKSLASMFGVSSDQAASGLPLETFTNAIHPEDKQRILKNIESTVASRGRFEQEYRVIDADNRIRWVIARGQIESNKDGTPVAFPGVIVDISDRKAMEDQIRSSQEQLRFMADTMPQLLWVTRADGYHEYYNQQWYDYTGTTYEQTKGEGWNGMFHPDDRERSWKVWNESLKTGKPYEIEYRLRNAKTGEYRWFVGRAKPFKDPQGNIIKWYGSCTDIQDSKHAQLHATILARTSKSLSSSLDYKKTFQKVATILVPEFADWCSIETLNENGTLDLVAIHHRDPKKVSWAHKLRAEYPPDLSAPTGVPNVLRTGKSELYPHITNDILEATVTDPEQLATIRKVGMHSVLIAPLKICGKAVGAITLIYAEQDKQFGKDDLGLIEEICNRASIAISNANLYKTAKDELAQRKKLERQLRVANEKLESRVRERTEQLEITNSNLERSNSELQNFAYVASHDLQEPLRKIQAFGNLLVDEYGTELKDGAEYLERMRKAASRMSVLIEDLLEFSRVTTQARPFIAVDLNDVVQEVLEDLETRIKETDGSIVVDKLPIVTADPLQMRQLFQNLIGNALKFHKENEHPIVHISSLTNAKSARLDMHQLQVTDNGIGFDEKYLDRIFSVFQRLHTRDAFSGTGIGLAVCKKIVERHGGSITAKSKEGKGSTFIMTLRKHPEENV